MKIQYREFEGPAMIAMGDENRSRKTQTHVSIFLARFSSSIEGPPMIVMEEGGAYGWFGDENSDRKNRTDVFNFFSRDFCHPIFLINGFDNLKFSKLIDEDAISRI